jgi:hypothetical protein
MKQKKIDKVINNYWMDNYTENGLCILCGNHGIIDTSQTAISAAKVRCGKVTYCICPNGQILKKQKYKIPQHILLGMYPLQCPACNREIEIRKNTSKNFKCKCGYTNIFNELWLINIKNRLYKVSTS